MSLEEQIYHNGYEYVQFSSSEENLTSEQKLMLLTTQILLTIGRMQEQNKILLQEIENLKQQLKNERE